MKHWRLIVTVLVVIILAGILIFLLNKPTKVVESPLNTNPFSSAVDTGTTNQVTDPATFSINFYKWYIGNREVDPSFPSTTQLADSFTQWMTPAFTLQYQSTISDPNNDADPILFAQDDPRTWGSGLAASILSQTDKSASVQVLIGSGSQVHTYTVQLLKSNGEWRINSIAGTY